MTTLLSKKEKLSIVSQLLEYNSNSWFVWLARVDMGFLGFVLFVVYVGGIWKFLSGYGNTNFNASLPGRVSLALLWPVLIIGNKSYRRNFNKALKGR